jgi:hypothetical protein
MFAELQRHQRISPGPGVNKQYTRLRAIGDVPEYAFSNPPPHLQHDQRLQVSARYATAGGQSFEGG